MLPVRMVELLLPVFSAEDEEDAFVAGFDPGEEGFAGLFDKDVSPVSICLFGDAEGRSGFNEAAADLDPEMSD